SRPPTIRINPCLAAAVPDGVDVQRLCGDRLCCAVRGERAWLLRAVPQDSARPQPAALCDRSALPRAAIPAAATAVALFRRHARRGIGGEVSWPDGRPRARARHDRAKRDFCPVYSARAVREAPSRLAAA